MKIATIIVNYNGGRKILGCLQSLEAQKKDCPGLKTIVVDNVSRDNSIQLIKKRFPNTKIFINQKNLGFAAGGNVGIRQALEEEANAVLLLNQDAVVEKGFLEPLLTNSSDIVGPVIKFRRRGRWVYDYGGKINWWLGRTEHVERPYAIRHTPYAKDIDYVSGCAMLIRRPVLEKIGLLDEGYFLYFEDVDYCLRAQKAGFKIGVELKSQIIHQLAEKKSLASRWYLVNSHWRFINYWCHWPFKILAYFYWLLVSVKILI